MQERVQSGGPFLWINENPRRSNRVRAGEILCHRRRQHNRGPSRPGLIHDWTAAAFLPNTTLNDTFAVLGTMADIRSSMVLKSVDSKLAKSNWP